MIPLYILGLLQRFGPQHGYQIKKTMAEELSDFTQIKLPAIYYHLGKMKNDDLLSAGSGQPGEGPRKTVYAITPKGIDSFQSMLAGLLDFSYRPSFPSDSVFYFSDCLDLSDIANGLEAYADNLRKTIGSIQMHRKETLAFVPAEVTTMVNIIFSHHERHYQAELDWATEALSRLDRGGASDGKAKGH
ncbi:MAG: PadR family transcriptional regulator [Clostridia bacterium]|nr:PadR family transcriptional regulator [Clostridia bacterium]